MLKKMDKKTILSIILLSLILILALSFMLRASASREVTLTTYYPAPYGNYKDIYATDLTVNGVLSASAPATPGTGKGRIYFNSSENKFKVSEGGAYANLGGGGPWTEASPNIYNTNLGYNVGIGTASPNYPLDVNGSIKTGNWLLDGNAANGAMYFSPLATGEGVTMAFYPTNYNSSGFTRPTFSVWGDLMCRRQVIAGWGSSTSEWFVDVQDNNSLTFSPYASKGGICGVTPSSYTPKLTMTTDGKVGIGTTDPGAGRTDCSPVLHVKGATKSPAWTGMIIASGPSNAVVLGELNDVATISAHNAALTAWANLAISPAGGNVGIGTSTPQYRLEVNGAGSQSYVNIESSASGDTVNGGAGIRLRSMSNGGFPIDWRIYNSHEGRLAIAAFPYYEQGQPEAGMINLYYKNMWNGNHSYIVLNGDVVINGTATCTSGSWSGSDIRFKKNISTINKALDKVLKLRGVLFEWKTKEYKKKGFPKGKHYGVIAQEIEKVLPEIVNTGPAPEKEKAVSYTEIIPVLIEAIKDQQKQITELKEQQKTQQKQITELKAQNKLLEQRLEALEKAIKVKKR